MSTLGDLPPEQARLWMHRVAGWVADYRDTIERRRVTPDVAPGDAAAALPAAPPEKGEPLAAIFEDFERTVLPGLAHGGHPQFLGSAGSAPTAPGILGDWLATALGAEAMAGHASPAAAELQTTVLRWIRDALGLADAFEGVVHETAAAATLHALAAARDAAGLDVRRRGLRGGPPLMIYASDEAARVVEEAAMTLGLGEDSVRRVETDGEFRIRPAALRATIARDLHARLRPLAVVATVGTAASAAVDPVPAVADVCREHGLWLHVDASHGGALALLPEDRWVLDGVGRADSIVVDPHRWLFVPPDFSVLYTRHPEAVRAAALPGAGPRRGRTLEAWMAFRAFGRAGLEVRLREHVRLARRFADWVAADPDFELAAPVAMGVVCFRANPADRPASDLDALNRRLVERVAATGRVVLTTATLAGRLAIRLAIANVLTTEAHLQEAWTLVHDALDRDLVH
jgi:aromatic-L-amino-acid decarboxylase